MTHYVKAWLVPWEPGQLGVGYTTETGKICLKELRERDPEFPQLRALLGPLDADKVERHFAKAVSFERH